MSNYGEFDKKPLIVCALKMETQHQIDDYEVLYTGVGKVNATHKLTQKFGKFGSYIPYNMVINYGTAGSRKYQQGELVDCTKFVQRDMDVTGLGFIKYQTPFEDDIPIQLDCGHVNFNHIGKKASCGSADNFVKGDKQYGDVVDMEAYALAKVCWFYNIPFISFKYITDGADGDADIDWEENVTNGIMIFKRKVLDLIEKSS